MCIKHASYFDVKHHPNITESFASLPGGSEAAPSDGQKSLYQPTVEPSLEIADSVRAVKRPRSFAQFSKSVELSRKVAEARGIQSCHKGYTWPRHTFFSSGLNNPSSGAPDRMFMLDIHLKLDE